MGYNTSIRETTGHTPFELTFGRQANMPSSISNISTLTKDPPPKLFKLWKNRHNAYIAKTRQITELNKKRYHREQIRKIIKIQTIFQVKDKV